MQLFHALVKSKCIFNTKYWWRMNEKKEYNYSIRIYLLNSWICYLIFSKISGNLNLNKCNHFNPQQQNKMMATMQVSNCIQLKELIHMTHEQIHQATENAMFLCSNSTYNAASFALCNYFLSYFTAWKMSFLLTILWKRANFFPGVSREGSSN